MKITLILATLLTFTGCATKWGHSTASQNDFQRDIAQCELFSKQTNPNIQAPYNPFLTSAQQNAQTAYQGGAAMGAAINQSNTFNTCMQAKGYYKTK
jgi:hypothetical protein